MIHICIVAMVQSQDQWTSAPSAMCPWTRAAASAMATVTARAQQCPAALLFRQLRQLRQLLLPYVSSAASLLLLLLQALPSNARLSNCVVAFSI
jgi:hypothetical protein